MVPTAASTALPAPATAPGEPTALERALRLALTSSSSSSGDGDSVSVLQAICADTELLRDAQVLFAQLVPRTSPSSTAATSLGSTFRGSAVPPQSPFSAAFDRSTRLSRENPLDAAAAHEKMSALVAVVATGVSRELQQEKRDEEEEEVEEEEDARRGVELGSGGTKRKRQEPLLSTAAYARKNGERDGTVASHAEPDKQMPHAPSPPSSPTTTTWDLVGLLTDAHVSLSAFLRHFTSLFDRLLLDPELLEVATQLKEEFTVATVLFEKYRTLWRKVVPPVASGHVHEPARTIASGGGSTPLRHVPPPRRDEVEREPDASQRTPPTRKMSDLLLEQLVSVDRHALLHDAGWLLFLLAKRRLSAHYTGLGQLYFLLLAVLHLVLTNLSAPSIEAEVAAALSALGATAGATGDDSSALNAKLLDALCANPKVDQHEVTRAAAHLDAVLLQLRSERDVLVTQAAGTATDASAPAPANSTSSSGNGNSAHAYARAVLHESVIADNVARLSAHYRREYVDGCGKLDERFYLDAFAYQVVMGPKPLPPSHPPLASSGGGGATGSSALSSPVPTKRPARTDRLVPPNPFASPARAPMTPQRLDRSGAVRGSSTPLSAHPLSGTPGPPASPFTRQAWQFHGSSPPPPSSAARTAMHTPNTRAFLHTATAHQASPFVAQTPVTAAIETSNWIRDTLANASGFVSPQLKLFFRDCASDPTDHIARVLHELSQRLLASRRRVSSGTGAMPTPTPSLDDDENVSGQVARSDAATYSEVDSSLQKTKNLAIALFYRVLEALLQSERERLRTTNFASLLHNESFVASLFACSLEVVLKAHSLITLAFPFLLDIVGVNAFDFGKIIESFVKHVPALPHALKRHMRDLEQSILDSLAWRADSGLYVVLAGGSDAAKSATATATTTSDALLASLTNGTPISTFSTNPTNATASTTRTSVLQLFFRKVLSLAASRIFRLGTLLELDAKYLNQVWTAIKECISSHHALLKDRHLDHVILCSLYGVCKVNHVRPEVTFKRVIDAYKKLQSQQHTAGAGSSSGGSGGSTPITLARSSNDVIRNIKLDDGSRGDIIKFYNRCYIPTMKVFMLQFQVQDKQMAAADAVVASAVAAAAAPGSASQAPPGFTPRREGSVVAASTSDTEIVAEAAADAVEKVMKSYGLAPGPGTPNRALRRVSGITASPRLTGSPMASLQLFTTAEVQSLPVSVHQTSPKRVLASNIYMSPLQQARLHHRSHLTPRSHALYAFGESPSRDLALINRAVNTTMARTRVAVPPPLVLTESHEEDDDDDVETSESNSNSAASTPTNSLKRRRA